jgi:hypothetical protein
MLEKARALATAKSRAVIANALASMRAEMAAEIARLRDLAEVNDHIKPEEITALAERETEVAAAIENARVRLDAVRLIWKAPSDGCSHEKKPNFNQHESRHDFHQPPSFHVDHRSRRNRAFLHRPRPVA